MTDTRTFDYPLKYHGKSDSCRLKIYSYGNVDEPLSPCQCLRPYPTTAPGSSVGHRVGMKNHSGHLTVGQVNAEGNLIPSQHP